MEKENKKPRLFGLWFALSLICGLVTAGLLVGLIWATISSLITGDSIVTNYSEGQGFVALISSLIVFGAFYVIGTFKSGKVLNEKRKSSEAVKVLSIIYASFIAIPAFIMLILFIVPLVELGVGTSTNICASIAQLVCSALSFAILLKMAFYQLGFWGKWLKRTPWAIGFSVFTIVIIVLFMIFPGGQLRGITSDQLVSIDLEKIDEAIRDHVDINEELPATLSELDIDGLKASIDDFKYSVLESEGSSYLKFEICADFTINTGSVSSYSFDFHPAGNVCFERSVYKYSPTFRSYDY